jgi:caffeoyl-CoA O-methyltransferase
VTPPIVDPTVEAYAEDHTTTPRADLLDVARATEEAQGRMAQMMVGALEGRFLEFLVFAKRPQRVLEIGTFTGYSALSMVAALPPGGSIITCEFDPDRADMARAHIAATPYASAIDVRVGPALDTIATLEGPFDLVFIDADKPNYLNYFNAVLPLLADDGIIAADNTLWSGQVVDTTDNDEQTVAIRAFNDAVAADPRVVCAQLTIRDGVTLIRKVEAV